MRGRCGRHSMNQSDDEAVSTSPPLAFKFWMCGFFCVCVLSNFVLYTPQSVQCKEIKYGFCGCCWNSIWNFHSQASFRSVDGWMQWQRLICHWMVFIEFIHRIHLKFQIFEMFRWRDRFNQMLDDIRAYSLRSEVSRNSFHYMPHLQLGW